MAQNFKNKNVEVSWKLDIFQMRLKALYYYSEIDLIKNHPFKIM